jgi:hypothetical protein
MIRGLSKQKPGLEWITRPISFEAFEPKIWSGTSPTSRKPRENGAPGFLQEFE